MPPVSGSLPCPPAHGFPFPFPAPVNRPQYQPAFLQAEQCFRPAVYEQLYRPRQCLPFHETGSFAQPSLRLPCRPHMIPPFDAFPQRYLMDASLSIRQPFFLPHCPEPRHFQSLQGVPHAGELNAPVVSAGFERIVVRSSSESALSRQTTPGQASEVCAASEPVQTQSKPVLPDSNRNVDVMYQKSRESVSSCVNDEHRSDRDRDHDRDRDRHRDRDRDRQRRRSDEFVRSRRRERSSHRDSHKDSTKPRTSALDNRLNILFYAGLGFLLS